jgi:hypothetical protein
MNAKTKISRSGALLAAAILLAAGAGNAAAEDKVPADQQGDWVPAKAACQSPLRFRVAETRMTLINGKDSESYGDIGITHTFFGPDYQGISFVAIPEFNRGDTAFTVYFNADEKKGMTKLSILVGQEAPGNDSYNAIVRAAKKLNQRFPLDNVLLKKCPVTP